MKLPDNYVLGVGVVKPTAKGGIGQRLLEKLGWKDGEGLGKHKTGIVEAIDQKKRDGKDGIGKKKGFDWANPFWENAYESALSKVNEAPSTSSSSTSSTSSDTTVKVRKVSSDCDEQILKRRKKGVDTCINQDGTVTTAHESELQIFDFLSKGRIGRWGGRGAKLARIRQQEEGLAEEARKKLGLSPISTNAAILDNTQKKKKTSKTKHANEKHDVKDIPRTFSSSDLRGETSVSRKGKSKKSKGIEEKSQKSARKKSRKQGKSTEKEGTEDDEGKANTASGLSKENSKEKSEFKAKKGKKRCRSSKLKSRSQSNTSHCAEEALSDTAQKKPKKKGKKKAKTSSVARDNGSCNLNGSDFPVPTPNTGWWGAKRFISGGFAGQVREVVPLDHMERQEFDEDDQEKVYMFAHNSKRKGKIGLGC